MKSNDMINLIIDVEKNQHGITQLYPSRIHYFQRTKRYDKYTYEALKWLHTYFNNWRR